MFPPVPCHDSFVILLVLSAAGVALVSTLFDDVWRVPYFRGAVAVMCGLLAAAHASWELGISLGSYATCHRGMIAATVGNVVLGFTVASLPFAAALRRVLRVVLCPRRRPSSGPVAPPAPGPALVSRRTFVACATAAVPLAAASTALRGFVTARDPTASPVITFRFPGLHPDLDGFTILQLSDLHLGVAKHVRDVEDLFDRLSSARRLPDLVVVTGDVADDLGQLAPALARVHDFGARYGAFASLGNHEYLHDIRATRPIFERSPVPLLVERGVDLRVGSARLHVAGCDDPVTVHADIQPFLRGSVERAVRDAGSDAFRLLLAHRPEAFEVAAPRGSVPLAHLTLSGHTHGGQIGFNGKSAFQPLWPDGYLWGAYRRGDAQLYTTSGFGHWFPFRVGCPAEAPLIELRRG